MKKSFLIYDEIVLFSLLFFASFLLIGNYIDDDSGFIFALLINLYYERMPYLCGIALCVLVILFYKNVEINGFTKENKLNYFSAIVSTLFVILVILGFEFISLFIR